MDIVALLGIVACRLGYYFRTRINVGTHVLLFAMAVLASLPLLNDDATLENIRWVKYIMGRSWRNESANDSDLRPVQAIQHKAYANQYLIQLNSHLLRLPPCRNRVSRIELELSFHLSASWQRYPVCESSLKLSSQLV